MISVIIPAFNEAEALPATLERVTAEAARHEVIVVDGGSTDETCAVAMTYPNVRVVSAEKGRAQQLNAGARLAGGDCLLFLHADTLLPQGALATLATVCREGSECEAGGFRHRFSDADWKLSLISALHNLRCRITDVFFGDQAMFVSRELFWRLGGFACEPMEDLLFSEKVRQVTRPLLVPAYVVTDSRKFVKHGVFRSFGRVVVLLVRHQLRLPVRSRRFFEDVR